MLKGVKSLINKIKWRHKDVIFNSGSKIDRKSVFEGRNRIAQNTVIGRCIIGFGSYIGENAVLKDTAIGKYSCIGPNVKIVVGAHPASDLVSIHPAFYSTRGQAGFSYVNKMKFTEFIYADKKEKKVVLIGNDVWIGYGVIIMSGITIGDGAIIAAGAIVTKDVEPYSIYAGVPAKLVKYRFENEDIKILTAFKWWNQSEEWIKEYAECFENISKFKNSLLNSFINGNIEEQEKS